MLRRILATVSVFALFMNVMPLNVAQAQVSTTFFGFKLSQNVEASFDGDQQVGAGAFSSGNIANGNSGVYSEGMCVPLYVSVQNTDPSATLINSSVTFDHNKSGIAGYSQLEMISGVSIASADNLSDIVFSGNDLTSLASVSSNLGASVPVVVTGPFGPTNAALVDSDDMGHYDVTLTVPANDTVVVPLCARLSDEAGAFSRGSELQVRLGNGETININPSNLLELPEFTVVKTTTDGTPASNFTMQILDHNDSFAVVAEFPGSESGTTVTLPPGTYSVSEVNAPGYIANYSLGCTGVTMNLANTAEFSTCTVTNSPINPDVANLSITKVLVNPPAETLASQFSYNLYLDGIQNGSSTAFGDDGLVTVGNIEIGTLVQVTEQDPGELWTESYSEDCGASDAVSMDADGLNCVITNTFVGPTTGTITVTKDLITDDGSTDTVDSFIYSIDGNPITLNTPVVVAPGAHTVTESWAIAPENGDAITDRYSVTYGLDCATDGVLEVVAGDALTCAITNDDMPAQLTVIKTVGGIADVPSSMFNMTIVAPSDAMIASFPGDPSGTVTQVDAGTYIVGETLNPDYVPFISGDCDTDGSITLVPGQEAICTVANEYSPLPPETGRVTVVKTVVGSQDLDSAFQFTLTTNDVTGEPINFTDDAAIEFVLDEGTEFSVAEVLPLPAGYASETNELCSGVIAEDSVFECVITNTYSAGNLTITKVVENSEAAFTDFSYTLALNGGDATMSSFEADGTTVYSLPIGTSFTAVEVSPGLNWNSSSEGCTGVITAEGATCTITNTRIVGDLTITKVVQNSDAAFASFSYSLSLNEGAPVVSAFDEDGSTTYSLPIGTSFSVVEVSPGADWRSTTDGCTGEVTVDGVTCIITNTFVEDEPEPTGPVNLTTPCVEDGAPGRLVAHFGYSSENATNVSIPVSINNLITGDSTMILSPVDQITTFFPGLNENAFTIDFDEELLVNWTLNGDTVSASADSAVCDFSERISTLTIRKFVINDNGDGGTSDDFTLDVSGVNPSQTAVQGSESGVVVNLDPGAYSVTEAPVLGYFPSYSLGCSGSIMLGQDLNCTVTNDDLGNNGTITVNLEVINDNGGTLLASDVDLFVDGLSVENGVMNIFAPSIYLVTRSATSGYDVNYSGDCNSSGNVMVTSGNHSVCNIVLNDASNPGSGGSVTTTGGGGSRPEPREEILGDSDEVDEDTEEEVVEEEDPIVIAPVPTPIVAGESDEQLPRTGVPVAGLLALGSVLTFLARRKED